MQAVFSFKARETALLERFRRPKPKLHERMMMEELARLPIIAPEYHLDKPLLTFADGSDWQLRDLFEHVHVFGEPGSGKSSGSMATLYRECARDMGMLCLTAKEDEPGRLIKMALQVGRPEQSIIVIDDQLKWRFNFLDYEMKRRGGGDTFTIVETLLAMVEAKRRLQGAGSGAEQGFWRDAATEMLTHCINVLKLTQDALRLKDIHRYLSSMPRSPEQMNDGAFMDHSFAAMQTARALVREEDEGLGGSARMAMDYLQQTAHGDNRTSGNILVTITSMLQPFMSGTLHDLFCTETNWAPELVLDKGALTIIAFPVLLYKQLGVLAQIIFKAAFSQACGARPDNPHSLPVVLYADEAQNFYTEDDNRLAEMGRSKRVSMIYGTQNIGNYIRALGGANAAQITESLLGNFGTKIFHANTHPGTNEYAAKMIGRRLQTRESVSTSAGRSSGTSGGQSRGTSKGKSWGWSFGRSWGSSGGKSKSTSKGWNWGFSNSRSHNAQEVYPGGGSWTNGNSGGRNGSTSTSENSGWNNGSNQGQNSGHNEGENFSVNQGWNEGTNESWGRSATQHMDNDLEPAIFVSQLRTGGKRHGLIVDAIVIQSGRNWNDGRNWTLASFKQE